MSIFRGSFTALITPFHDGKVDEQAFRDFVEWQITSGVHGLVPCGTTGESPSLSHDEHQRVDFPAAGKLAGLHLLLQLFWSCLFCFLLS